MNETASDATSSNRNITELLFHPANFENTEMKMMMRTDQEAVKFAEDMSKMDMDFPFISSARIVKVITYLIELSYGI